MSTKFNAVFGFFTFVGVLLFVGGIAVLCSMHSIMHAIQQKINRTLPLQDGSESFSNWLDPPVPVYMQFWVFNVTNPDDIVLHGAKPVVEQLGPYTYREVRVKENVTFFNDSQLISYIQGKSYVFDRDMSSGSENDTFISVNFPVLTIAEKLHNWPGLVQKVVKWLLEVEKERLFESFSVRGYLFGFKEKLVKKINDRAYPFIHRKLIKNDIFGLFYQPPATAGESYVVHSGAENVGDINVIEKWNNQSSLVFWETEYCNMINGTDGTMWHPDVKTTDKLYLFSSDICRSIYATHNGNVSVQGIHLMHFEPPAEVFANHIENPDNAGFCTPNCLGSGVLNIARCKDGAPVVISQPHFYQADQMYIDAITGMHPSHDYQTYIDVEPMTGVAMKVSKLLQVNIHIRQLKALNDTVHFNAENGTIFPLVWLNESATITESSANAFKKEIMLPIKIIRDLRYVLIAVGAAIILALVVALFVKVRKERANMKFEVLVNDVAGDT